MKNHEVWKILLLIPFILGKCSNIYCQIELDWKKKELGTDTTYMEYGNNSLISVKDINPFRYKVSVKSQNYTYQSEMPPALKTFFVQKDLDTQNAAKETQESKDELDKNIEKMAELAVRNPTDGSIKQLVSKCKYYQKTLIEATDYYQKLLELGKKMDYLMKTCETKSCLISAISVLEFPQKEIIDSINNAYTKEYHRVEVLYESTADLLVSKSLLVEAEQKVAQMKQGIRTIANNPGKPEDIVIRGYLYPVSMDSYLRELNRIQELEHNHRKNEATINEALEGVESAYEKFSSQELPKLYSLIQFQKWKIENTSGDLIFPGTQATGDVMDVEISSEDVWNESAGPTIQKEIPIKGGWRTDFSVGPSISWGDNSRDHSFYLNQIDTNSFTLGQHVPKSEARLTPLAMLHYVHRTGTKGNFALGPMLGLGLELGSLEAIQVSLFTGLSLVLGRRQRFVFSGGIGFYQVARLKTDQYNIGSSVDGGLDIGTVTLDVLKSSPFLSFSYSLTKKKKA